MEPPRPNPVPLSRPLAGAAWRRGLALLLAGCAAALASAASDGRVHVSYWEKWVGPEEAATRAAIDAFNRSQSRITVEYYVQNPIDRKTLVAIAGGDPPDVSGLWIQNLASFADAEALLPLDGFIRRDGLTNEQWLSRYYPVYARMVQHGGHVYAGISTPAMIALHWNKTLFREAGLDPERPPRTVAELDEYARKLTKRDPQTGALLQVGFLPQEPGWWPWIFCRWFGGKFYEGNRITLASDPRNVAAMQWVANYTKTLGRDAVTSFASGFAGQWASSQSGFFSGKVAMIFQGVWYQNYIRQYKPGLEYGVAPAWPSAVPGIDDFGMAEADLLVIPRGARHPAEAWEFIKYMNSHNPAAQRREELAGMELMCFLQQKNSALRDWSPFFAQHHPHPDIAVFRQLSASPHAEYVPDMGIWTECEREVLSAFAEIRLLLATPEEALGASQRRLQQSWDRHLRSLARHGQPLPPGTQLTP
jgi:ABC-type glycerol-3-phosphate transport system substrate-binding protein